MKHVIRFKPECNKATLGDLITVLKSKDVESDFRVEIFGYSDWQDEYMSTISAPHSYRGYYNHICFEPKEVGAFYDDKDLLICTVLHIKAMVLKCIGATYTGWKGGDYTMGYESDIYIASPGHTGWYVYAFEIDVEERKIYLLTKDA